MSRGAVLLAATLAGMLAPDTPRERPPRPAPGAGRGNGRDRRPRPQRYFGGKAGRKMTRMLRMQSGRRP